MKLIPLILAMFVSLATSMSLTAAPINRNLDDKIEQFAKHYASEKSPFKRRSLCIEAIDNGLFKKGDPVSIIDRLFGSHFAEYYVPNSQPEVSDAVFFSPQPPQDGYNQVAAVGWYLSVTWDKTKTIQDYDLSNLHK